MHRIFEALRAKGRGFRDDDSSGLTNDYGRNRMPKIVRLALLCLLAMVILAAILLSTSRMTHPKMSVINNSPLDIKLVGVRPDSGDELFDANGGKIGEFPEFPVVYTDSWSPQSQCRDFIFEVPEVKDQLIFATFQKISVSENNRSLSAGFRRNYSAISEPNSLTYSVTFNRSYRRNLIPFLNISKQIDYIDFTLRYFYGPRLKATRTFIGPFVMDRAVKAQENENSEITFRETDTHNTGIQIHFKSSEYLESIQPVFLYDKKGKRYIPGAMNGHGGSGGIDYRYDNIPLSPDEIAAVTFGEQPYEITFKNIKVRYNNLPPPEYPECLDAMAQRLNLSGLTGEQLRQYDFKNPQEAIEAIDILQSRTHILKALQTIRFNLYNSGSPSQDMIAVKSNPKVQISQLDLAAQDRIHQTALKWIQNSNIKQYGIELGLMGKWPEFFDLAIERLNRKIPDNYLTPETERMWREEHREIISVMLDYRPKTLTSEQVLKIKQLILDADDNTVLQQAFYLLDRTKSQETTDALRDLAQDDKPWIWWRAINAWYPRAAKNGSVYDQVPENIKVKLLLFLSNKSDESLNAKLKDSLKQIFTPELARLDSGAWDSVRKKIAQKFNKKEAAGIYINYLRLLQKETTSRKWILDNTKPVWNVIYIIRVLNVWYDMNIGNIGTGEIDLSLEVKLRNLAAFKNLIDEVLDWYEDNQDTEPVEPAFSGKVVDTFGNPVADAKLIFTKKEDYQDERGFKNQRRVEVAQIAADTHGQFSVVLDPSERSYELNVTSDGFLTRERLMVYCLDDGRFRYIDRYTKVDNVIIIQRPGRISGTVIGVDGRPLANAELQLFANYIYSTPDPRKTITTDSQGKFDVNGLSTDPMILSYTKLNQVPQGGTSRREYGGLCGALILTNKEGQEQSGIVLDLSKSVCSLELDVKDEAGEPVDSLNVFFETKMPAGSGYFYNTVFYSREENSDGIYKFDGLPPGQWHLRISSGDYPDQALDLELGADKPANHQVIFGSAKQGTD
ncbi:MAG: hypothetical protein P8016_09625 [Sedimentisphaerales bacterium]